MSPVLKTIARMTSLPTRSTFAVRKGSIPIRFLFLLPNPMRHLSYNKGWSCTHVVWVDEIPSVLPSRGLPQYAVHEARFSGSVHKSGFEQWRL